ncbi:hypothetical protein [Nannocystis pusilla]|uniref:Uncharacterized protein n=1 Tax=Nannocystis pusilla TaxID=889268 RepID=A0ABS7TY07_9BACT|nr:hypothetical protein [Nannocystis pusilla]MBZ5713105.1 hypothetical protein [Nannocystis pusilla]
MSSERWGIPSMINTPRRSRILAARAPADLQRQCCDLLPDSNASTPPFRVVYGARKGKRTYWPAHAAAQAAWVREQSDAGRTFDEIRDALAAGEFTPPATS